ncbi:MAG: hypothetical protein GY870_18230, partial [archaeon]|nr:hypothetical protein [archaeon]
ITNKHPFILQTTSLGPRSGRDHSNIQGYRKIIINNNRIDGFEFSPLLRYYAPFEAICGKEKISENNTE